ncbi:MAG: SDR family oxidoreductase [Myxococcota bacterium]
MSASPSPSFEHALITGASRGLGLALARELGRHGSRVSLVARNREALNPAVETLRRGGIDAEAFVADVARKEAIWPLVGEAVAVHGPVDLLVNNASSLGPTPLRPLLDTACEDLAAVVETNLIGPFRLTKAIAGPMALRGRGTIVNVSSGAAVEAYPHWGSYGVSKAALDHLTRIWRQELARSGVRLVAVDPGEMDTAMHAAALPDADRSQLASPQSVARRIVALLAPDEILPARVALEAA